MTPAEVRGVNLQVNLPLKLPICKLLSEMSPLVDWEEKTTTTKNLTYLGWEGFETSVLMCPFCISKSAAFCICFHSHWSLVPNSKLGAKQFVSSWKPHLRSWHKSCLHERAQASTVFFIFCTVSLLAFFAILFNFLSSNTICLWILSTALFYNKQINIK